jgi:ribosomal protein S27AE
MNQSNIENPLTEVNKNCPNCNYFLIDIISWDTPLQYCQRCQYEKQTGEKLNEFSR